MSLSFKALASNSQVSATSAAAANTVYTATNVHAQITGFTAYNSAAASVVLSLYILTSGQSAASVLPIASQRIQPGTSAVIKDILGHVVPKNGTIKAFAGTTNVIRLTASGVEVAP